MKNEKYELESQSAAIDGLVSLSKCVVFPNKSGASTGVGKSDKDSQRSTDSANSCMNTTTKILQAKWDSMFDRLILFKKENGHCLVPNRYQQDKALGTWVSAQRRAFKMQNRDGKLSKRSISEKRIKRLNEVGFAWTTSNPRYKPWQKRYDQLRAFHAQNGHCLVPFGFKVRNPPTMIQCILTSSQIIIS